MSVSAIPRSFLCSVVLTMQNFKCKRAVFTVTHCIVDWQQISISFESPWKCLYVQKKTASLSTATSVVLITYSLPDFEQIRPSAQCRNVLSVSEFPFLLWNSHAFRCSFCSLHTMERWTNPLSLISMVTVCGVRVTPERLCGLLGDENGSVIGCLGFL